MKIEMDVLEVQITKSESFVKYQINPNLLWNERLILEKLQVFLNVSFAYVSDAIFVELSLALAS